MKQKALLALAILGIIFVSGCVQSSPEGGDKASQPLNVNLALSEEPILNKEVELSFSVQPYIDAPNTTIEVILPEGFEYVSGDLRWNGNLAKNEVKVIKSRVKSVRTGTSKIIGTTHIQLIDGSFGKADILYVLVNENWAKYSKDQNAFAEPN